MWPVGMVPTPLEVLPASSTGLAEQFLHPDVVTHLGHHFATAAVGTLLQVIKISLSHDISSQSFLHPDVV